MNKRTLRVGMGLLGVAGAAVALGASLYDIPLKTLEGKATSLGAYRGKVLLVVNVASQCGYTRQYKPLEAVYRKYRDQGLVVLGVPSNDFGAQEPGTAAEIRSFCSTKFDVTFPLLEKVQVKPGAGQSPLYAALTGSESPFPGPLKWNFGKFLISRDGRIAARFESKDEPDSPSVTEAIEAALKAK
ncbi:MAG TPA: glutathione peroxidase [Verrucomicrobiota bacterium]|nr:glutathione peroxidase [Verrucomicrobiota bacterium]HNU52618.1 glutathione peroxidase [Verrucomicrobiota bacterium]